jgi:hypothetical protein
MLAAVCGSCNGHHENIDGYRVCAGVGVKSEAEVMDAVSGVKTTFNPPSERQVKYALDLLEARVWPDGFCEEDLKGMERRVVSQLIDSLHKAPRKAQDRKVGAKGVKDMFHSVPDGWYAIQGKEKDGEKTWRFFEVKTGHTHKFLNMLIGSPGDYRRQAIYTHASRVILDQIRAVTPRQASLDFGTQSEICGVCHSPLTNPESIALGIGPKCRSKMGW